VSLGKGKSKGKEADIINGCLRAGPAAERRGARRVSSHSRNGGIVIIKGGCGGCLKEERESGDRENGCIREKWPYVCRKKRKKDYRCGQKDACAYERERESIAGGWEKRLRNHEGGGEPVWKGEGNPERGDRERGDCALPVVNRGFQYRGEVLIINQRDRKGCG